MRYRIGFRARFRPTWLDWIHSCDRTRVRVDAFPRSHMEFVANLDVTRIPSIRGGNCLHEYRCGRSSSSRNFGSTPSWGTLTWRNVMRSQEAAGANGVAKIATSVSETDDIEPALLKLVNALSLSLSIRCRQKREGAERRKEGKRRESFLLLCLPRSRWGGGGLDIGISTRVKSGGVNGGSRWDLDGGLWIRDPSLGGVWRA